MIFGYARVSTQEQSLDSQIDALKAAGAGRIFEEKISGSGKERKQLERLIDQLREGDAVVVTKYDRLARSLRDLMDLVETIRCRGADFKSLAENIDTGSPSGRLIFHVFGSIAEFERERIVERTKEGLAAARKRGRIGGRPRKLSSDQRMEVQKMRDVDCRQIGEIAAIFKVSAQTIRRA